MENQQINASEIAKQRLYEFIENIILIATFNDVALWGLYTFLLEQIKNYDPGNFSICPKAYQQDRDKALALFRQTEPNLQAREPVTTVNNYKEINRQENEHRPPERSKSRRI